MPTVKKDEDLNGKHGVQAAETVLQILSAFIDAEPMPMLKTLAERLAMHPAKVHRYLVSLTRMGYVEQDPGTSRYRLGPLSMRLGLAAISSVDSIKVAKPLMHGFCQDLGHTTILAIWNGAPTIALIEAAPGLITLTAREGTVLPILRSAIGRAFGAWMPRDKVANLLTKELADMRSNPQPACPTNLNEAEELFADIRKRGVARVTGQLATSFHGLAAPVFHGSGDLAAVLCVLGSASSLDSAWSGPTAKGLVKAAATLSAGLGYGTSA